MKLPAGFRIGGLVAGLKRSGRHDLGLIVGDAPLAWAFAGTRNRAHAPCVARNRARFDAGAPVRALVVNSGNANCANGELGVRDDERLAALAADALAVGADAVLTASTGVIGKPMAMDRVETALPRLVEGLDRDDVEGFAQAILTTDLVRKVAGATLGGGARVVGLAKGSGMIHPNMATMLAFVLTDAAVEQDALRAMWRRIVDDTFNQITVDGDTSTNDMAIVLASGLTPADPAELERVLEAVAEELAQKIARDGEGATTLVTVHVKGAATDDDARAAARSVVTSSLVKSAIHGRDPNWGRILSAVGNSGAALDVGLVTIALQGHVVYRGGSQPFDEGAVSQAMHADEVHIHVDLGLGSGRGRAWGCDLSAEYVRINAEYRT
jgi:glutamate N-acetyltransferase / amino-acid N-acetyltransferase